MSAPPVVLLEARLRREVPVPEGDRVTVTAGDRPGVSWEASWGLDGLAWSPRTIEECNKADAWRMASDGEGGLVIVTGSLRADVAVASALRRRRHRPPQVLVNAGQVWADRTAEGRLILVTDPDDDGRVQYKTITLASGRSSGKLRGRIARASLLSAYRLLPPGHPAYEAMRRDVAVRYPRRWETGFAGSRATAWFEDPESTAALAEWLGSESAWLAFRGWAVATEEAR